MIVPDPNRTATQYRYGFNGKEIDSETKGGEGLQIDYGFRIYDPRIGKFLSTDPLSKNFPWYSPYQFAGNKPINSIDLDGLEEAIVILDKFDEQGNAHFSITRNDNVMNNSNGNLLKLIFKDKSGNSDSKLIKKMEKFDATIRNIIVKHETSLLQAPNKPSYDYSLTVSLEGVKTSSAKVFNVDNGKIIGDQRTGFNSGGKTFATTKLNVVVKFKMFAQGNGSGGGGYVTADKYINNILVPAFTEMDNNLVEMSISKENKFEINYSMDNELSNNKSEFSKVMKFITDNYPNAEVNKKEGGPGAHILLIDQEISKGEMEEYNSTEP